jgi:hypothetical protein
MVILVIPNEAFLIELFFKRFFSLQLHLKIKINKCSIKTTPSGEPLE